ncbi:rubrerythrin [Candidatus Fermentibacteria bacterium]|nr:rubrerythrin [Candidatus Fermentibacteria bacterium]
MERWKSFSAALDFAIAREEESHDFYVDLAGRMEHKAMAEVFEQFAREELGHKKRLETVKSGGDVPQTDSETIQNLAIADYVVDVEPTPDMDYGDALVLAMKKEKAAFRLYNDLAANVRNPELADLFLMLAQEEAKHKLRFELEYDDAVLSEN